MTNLILSNHIASISELKANPMKTIQSVEGETVAILNRNQPVFYAVSPEMYEYFMELSDNQELVKIVNQRKDQEIIEVSLHDL